MLIHDSMAKNEPVGDDFLLRIMKKHSVIMFWVAITGVLFPVSFILFHDQSNVEGIPLILDYLVNAIAIFLSFSFNKKWFI